MVPASVEPLIKSLAAIIPPSWRMGQHYWHWRHQLEAAQAWNTEMIQDWQLRQLQTIVAHAYHATPGYRTLWDQAGVHPHDLRSLADLRRFPLTTKHMIQADLAAFSAEGISREYVTTGGSTGIPFGFYRPTTERARENAFIHTAWQRVGWRLGRPNAVLRGGYIGSEERPWAYDHFHRNLLLSSYYLTPRTVGRYLEAVERFHPPVLQAYPSTLDVLCRLLVAEGLVGRVSFTLILLGSENVYDWQLAHFQEVFPEATLFAWYGHSEQAAFAPWCPGSRLYHVQPLYGYVELLRDDGNEAEEGEEGEIVATTFHNRCTPLIRYRTMDRAVRGPSICDACGHRHLTFRRILGRGHERIVTATGRLIPMTAINMHDDIFDPLRQFQFFQEEQGKVVFRYVPKEPLTIEQEQRIRRGLTAKLGGDVDLSLCSLTEIPRTRSGKLSFLEQRLSIVHGEAAPLASCPWPWRASA